jgi:uncharacterized protein (DUF433 family)
MTHLDPTQIFTTGENDEYSTTSKFQKPSRMCSRSNYVRPSRNDDRVWLAELRRRSFPPTAEGMALSATAQVITGRAEDAARGMGTMAKGCEVELMIEKTDGVCGGSARISNTRIPVWLLVAYRLIDRSDAQLLEFFPDLNQADSKLVCVW